MGFEKKEDNEKIRILAASVFSGFLALVLIGFVSSFITNDDYYVHQNRSHFGDGRFVSGIFYSVFQGAFQNDVGFRYITIFFSGFLGFICFWYFSTLIKSDKKFAVYFSIISVASLAMAESLFFYDVVALYYVICFPAIVVLISAIIRYRDRGDRRSLLVYVISSIFTNIVLLSVYQVLAYFIFVMIAVCFYASEGREQRRFAIVAAIAPVAAIVSFLLIDVFARTDFYIQMFGYQLRGRTDFYVNGDFIFIEALKKYMFSVIDFRIFKYNSVSTHAFLVCFILLFSLSFKSKRYAFWKIFKFSFVMMTIYASPFLIMPGASDNPRVFAALYIYGIFAYLMIITFLVSEDINDSRIDIYYYLISSCIILVAIGSLIDVGYSGRVAKYEIYTGIVIFALCAFVLRVAVRASSRIILCCGVLVFCSVELQKSMNTTERWKSDAVFDRIIVDKLTEAVLDNYYRYGFKSLQIEYGIRPETLTGASIRSYHYSAAEFWKNSVQSLGYRMNFKRNDALCTEQGDYGVFKVIENSPNTLKFCI